MVEAAVLALEPAAADPDPGLLIHQPEEVVEHARVQARVRVESEEVAPGAAGEGDVRRGSEAEVPARLDQLDRRELARHLDGAVARVVVDHHDVHRPRRRMLVQRRQAIAEQTPASVGDDPDVEPVLAHGNDRQSWIETQRRIGKSS